MDSLQRYVRQTRFRPFGEEGQRRLMASKAVVCGCGALGSFIANLLVRAGVGKVRLVDRDFVEATNLHRQILFDENDAAAGMPKAVAAAERLRTINSTVEIEPVVADINYRTIESLANDVDIIMDGTDNFETRFLLNDVAVKRGLPWVYGGCIGADGQSMTIIPGKTPCLRCLMETCPAPGSAPTCDTVGVLGPIVGVIASFQAMEGIKILAGREKFISRKLTVFDLWENRIRRVSLKRLRERTDCPTCKKGEFPWLAGKEGSSATSLCGRNAVQIQPAENQTPIALDELAARLSAVGETIKTPYFVRLKVENFEITVFADGRAIVGGTNDLAAARTAHAKYIGV